MLEPPGEIKRPIILTVNRNFIGEISMLVKHLCVEDHVMFIEMKKQRLMDELYVEHRVKRIFHPLGNSYDVN